MFHVIVSIVVQMQYDISPLIVLLGRISSGYSAMLELKAFSTGIKSAALHCYTNLEVYIMKQTF